MSLFSDYGQDIKRRLTNLATKPVFPKPKRRVPSPTSTLPSSSLSPLEAFPLGRYLSLLSVFSLLQIFILIALPQTAIPFSLSTPRIKTSLDRPEWAWVAVLTKDPLATSVWVVLGGAVVAAWWSGEMGKMWEDEEERKLGGGDKAGVEKEEEEVMRKAGRNSKTVEVSSSVSLLPPTLPLAPAESHRSPLFPLVARASKPPSSRPSSPPASSTFSSSSSVPLSASRFKPRPRPTLSLLSSRS